MISALKRLDRIPDAVMVNGHGIAHPRRFGLASYLGVVLGLRNIGIAKRRLVGDEVGSSLLLDGEEVAKILRSGNVKIYVSVWHRISLEEAVRLVEATLVQEGSFPSLIRQIKNHLHKDNMMKLKIIVLL